MMDRYATLRDGLLWAWYPMAGATGYLLRDRTPYNRNATLVGASWAASPRGLSLSFSGSGQYASTTIASGLSNSFSFACWAKANATTGADFINILDSEVVSFSNIWAVLGVFQNKWMFSIYDGSRNPVAQNPVNVTLGQWYHIVGVRDKQTAKLHLYVDGVQVHAPNDTTTTTPTYATFGICGEANNLRRYFNGNISDARAWSRALTPGDVLALYSGGPGVGLRPQRHRRANALGSQFWLRDSGTWKKATGWIKVNGVWTKATPKLNVVGTWK